MSLHKQTLVIIGATFLGISSVLCRLTVDFVKWFTHLEETLIHQDVQRVLIALSDEITNLSVAANDDTSWD